MYCPVCRERVIAAHYRDGRPVLLDVTQSPAGTIFLLSQDIAHPLPALFAGELRHVLHERTCGKVRRPLLVQPGRRLIVAEAYPEETCSPAATCTEPSPSSGPERQAG